MKNKSHILRILFPWCMFSSIWAQKVPTLTITEALDRGLARVDIQTVFKGRTDLADSHVLERRAWDNPQLFISSENVEQAGVDAVENYLLFSQRLALFGVKKLRARAAEHEKNAVLLDNESQVWEMKALIKQSFYEVLFFRKRLEVLEEWESKTQKVQEIIALGENAGEVSGYDRRRLMLELSEVQAVTARDRAFHAASREQLQTLLELDETYELSGTLLPPSSAKEPAPSRHPSLQAFDEEIKAASLEERAARRGKLSEISVEAGFKTTRLAGMHERGVFLSARFPLPVFNRKKPDLMRAKARAMIARGEKAFAQSKAEGRTRALRRQIEHLRSSVEDYRKEVLGTSQELVDIAWLAYREGEMEITVLLEAYQSMRDAELKAISMEAETRGLLIELERIGGEQ